MAPNLKLRVVSEMCLRGPAVCRIPVECDARVLPKDVWVESAFFTDDCQVVEGNLMDICYRQTDSGFCGELMVAIPTGWHLYSAGGRTLASETG